MSFYTSGSDLFGNLPLFPTLYNYPQPITTERVENTVEMLFNVGDPIFLNGGATQKQYDRWSKALDEWADKYFDEIEEKQP